MKTLRNNEIRLSGNDARTIVSEIQNDMELIRRRQLTSSQEDIEFMEKCLKTRKRLLEKKTMLRV